SASEIVTDLPLPPEQAAIVTAMQSLTQLLNEQAPADWQTIRCDVRAAPQGSPRPLEIAIDNGNGAAEQRSAADPALDLAAMRLARTLTTSMSTFPGVAIEMTRLDQGRWRNHMKLMDR